MSKRKQSRTPMWDTKNWLRSNFKSDNGLPEFFRQGVYTFKMKHIAELDYIFTVKEGTKDSNNLDYQKWAKNMELNEHLALYNSNVNEYWRWLAEKEQRDLSRDKASNITLITHHSDTNRTSTKKLRCNFISNDTIYIDEYNDSFGTIVGRYVRNYKSTDSRSSYFKTLGMNNVIDISDDSKGSHLSQIPDEKHGDIKESLKSNSMNENPEIYNCQKIESIITKFNKIEDDKIFLSKVIKEIEEDHATEKVVKRVYLQVLESMLFNPYLFEFEDEGSEADYIIKLVGPIFENIFRESGCRLVWDDTKSSICLKKSNQTKLDVRIISLYAKTIDLSLSGYAKRSTTSEYYHDKKMAVITSLVHLKEIISSGNLSVEAAKKLSIPFVLCEGLESDIYTIRVISEDWTVVEKMEDADVPRNIKEVKEGKLGAFVQKLQNFKNMCISNNNTIYDSKFTKKSTKMNKKKSIATKLLQKSIWVDHLYSKEDDKVDVDDDDGNSQ